MRYLIYILFPGLLFAQEFRFVLETDSIPVVINHWQPFCPWVGGYSESSPDFVDINADGTLDLFLGEYFGWVSYFSNTGTIHNPDFSLISKQCDSLFTIGDWGRSGPDFCDIDNDGDMDAFIGSGYVTFVENIGTNTEPNFVSTRDTLLDLHGNWVFGTHVALIDIDSDGDGDLFGGEWLGHIQFYRNIGTPDSFSFLLEDSLWLSINNIEFADPCFIDIDNDSDYDLFIGEERGNIWYYRNDGDSVNYNFVYVTDNFEGIDVGDYASPEFADIDGDGDYDLFVGREANNNSLMGDIFFYENVGTATNPQFSFITKNYLSIDIGYTNVKPQVIDLDNDLSEDIIIGVSDNLVCFHNIGDSLDPSYRFITDNFQGISKSSIKPCFLDIDADGDYDLLCGEGEIPGPPELALYINNGTPQSPNLYLYNQNFITNPDFDVNIFPAVSDIDADGDYDLFITDDGGHFFFYRNNGSVYWPNFSLENTQWQGIQFYPPYAGWRGFCFGDFDSDLDFDLLIENIWTQNQPNLRFYRNVGTPQLANLELETAVFLPEYEIYSSVPFSVDIDNDGDLDLFIGENRGGIMFFRNMTGEFPNITLTPGVPSITIPAAGGSFDFTFTVNNPPSNSFNFDAWTEVALPTGRLITPILLRSSLTIAAGITASRQITQTVPGNAPAGNYIYIGNVGVYPDSVADSDEFGFVKTP